MLNGVHGSPTDTARARLVSFVALDGRDESTLLGLAASLASGLDPVLAAAILESARDRTIPFHHLDRCHDTARAGVAASVEGHRVVLGNAALFAALGLATDALGDWPERLRRRGQSVLFIAIDGRMAGFLGIEEDEMQKALTTDEQFSTDVAGVPAGRSPEVIEPADGGELTLRIAPVAKRVGDAVVRMLAYNGSTPGPMIRVRQGSALSVAVLNDGDLDATVHWHGLRLDNRYDGTTRTQAPIPVGGRFTYQLTFPDPGVYWYHPHIREDYGQEMGLYGNIVVVPTEPDYWPPVHRELTLMLDDLLIEDGKVAPFHRLHPTYTAMGRFGNVLLANGEPDVSLHALRGEVVRFYITNAANTRVFNLALRGARMKVIGGDSGRCERERFVGSVVVAPSERVVVDVLFDQPGRVAIEHRTPKKVYVLGRVTVAGECAEPPLDAQFETLRTNAEIAAVRDGLANDFLRDPDKTLALVAEMDMGQSESPAGAAAAYACPMHPEVTSARPDRCPKCGMKLVPAQLVGESGDGGHDHADPNRDHHDGHGVATSDEDGVPAGIEWEDDMVDVNRMTNPTNMRWKLIDRDTAKEGASIDWRFRVGDRVKIRLVNEMDSDHPMHHPFHVHGAGRFLILARDGVVEPHLVWKDTVLVPTGQSVDILLEVTHPGIWMAHCHIAEHHESGMMLSFRVDL